MEIKRRTLYILYIEYFIKIKRTWNDRAQYVNKTPVISLWPLHKAGARVWRETFHHLGLLSNLGHCLRA